MIFVLLIAAVIIGLLVTQIANLQQERNTFIPRLTKTSAQPTPPPPLKRFHKNKAVMTPTEAKFYRVLTKVVPEAPIFPKIRVADVINTGKEWSPHFRKISQKHFDWVLCDPNTFEPIVAIELDDASHQHWKNAKSDRTKNEAAKEAEIEIVRFSVSNHYDEENVREIIATAVNTAANHANS